MDIIQVRGVCDTDLDFYGGSDENGQILEIL